MTRGALKREFEQIAAYRPSCRRAWVSGCKYSVETQAGSEQFPLPPALVMTLVENAIKHGIEPAAEGGPRGRALAD